MSKKCVISKSELSALKNLSKRTDACIDELLNICQVLRNMSCNNFCSDEESEFNKQISEKYADFLANIKGEVQEVSDKIQGFISAYSDREVVNVPPLLNELEVDENSWGCADNYEEDYHVNSVLDEKSLQRFRDEWKAAFNARKVK
jgi:hypothetical protein